MRHRVDDGVRADLEGGLVLQVSFAKPPYTQLYPSPILPILMGFRQEDRCPRGQPTHAIGLFAAVYPSLVVVGALVDSFEYK